MMAAVVWQVAGIWPSKHSGRPPAADGSDKKIVVGMPRGLRRHTRTPPAQRAGPGGLFKGQAVFVESLDKSSA